MTLNFLFVTVTLNPGPPRLPGGPSPCTTMESAPAKQIYDKLLSVYGPQKCFLEHMTPFQLLVATILSAQCTDKRVNMVTRELFKRWPDAAAFASISAVPLGASFLWRWCISVLSMS